MEPLFIKLAIDVVLMLASKHPTALLDILNKVGPDVAAKIGEMLRNIEVKPASSYLDEQNRNAGG